jgi:glutamate synthase domain-containing protein 3
MTRGLVVVLGRTGRNFAAGMSGGVAYVLDDDSDFAQRCNLQMVDLESFEDTDEEWMLRTLIGRHAALTRSKRARTILDNWPLYGKKFVKVMPLEYRRVLSELRKVKALTMVQHG